MQITSLQRKTLMFYREHQVKSPTLGTLLRKAWKSQLFLVVFSLLMVGTWYALEQPALSLFFLGLLTGALASHLGAFLRFLRLWPALVLVLDWRRIEEILTQQSSVPRVQGTSEDVAADSADHLTKTCPACAEEIKMEALLCRHCGHRFLATEGAVAKEQALSRGAAQSKLLLLGTLEGRVKRRFGWGIALTVLGGILQVMWTAMAFGPTTRGNTPEDQLRGGLLCMLTTSLPLLLGGFLLIRSARGIRREWQEILDRAVVGRAVPASRPQKLAAMPNTVDAKGSQQFAASPSQTSTGDVEGLARQVNAATLEDVQQLADELNAGKSPKPKPRKEPPQ